MVESQIRPGNVSHEGIIEAFREIPREWFVPETLKGVCYADEETEFGKGRFLLAPALHARMIEETKPSPEDIVLDIGGSNGYSAAIWSRIVSTVINLEDCSVDLEAVSELWRQTESHNVAAYQGNLNEGVSFHKPYDIIFVGGAVASPPENLLTQLGEGGRLVTVLIEPGKRTGSIFRFVRETAGNISSLRLDDASCPYLPSFMPEPEFVF